MTEKPKDHLGSLIGASPVMQSVYERLGKAAGSNVTVLLTGASGTGKELAARAIHEYSGRRRGPFIPVNAGAIPKELTASELFGSEIGAFTGASVQRKGKFELAHGGTLFLDEIAATDQMTQVTLLRALEERSITRLGGRGPIPINVRFIAATNENLARAISEGRFREDLYYRLDIYQIRMPLLRERGADIMLLAQAFLEEAAREVDRGRMRFDDEACECIEGYSWPGNVRELRNSVQRAAVTSDSNVIQRKDLPLRVQDAVAVTREIRFKVGHRLQDVERAYVLETLRSCSGNKTETAEKLGISRKALYEKLARWESLSPESNVYGSGQHEAFPPESPDSGE